MASLLVPRPYQSENETNTNKMCINAGLMIVAGLLVASAVQGQRVYVGELPTLAHRVSGSFYILDNKTFFIEDFTYDGQGPDAFLYYYEVGEIPRSSGGGIIIPISDSQEKFAVGPAYNKENFTVNLQDGVVACDIGYFTIWCRRARQHFTTIAIPQEFFTNATDELEGKVYCLSDHMVNNGSSSAMMGFPPIIMMVLLLVTVLVRPCW